MTNAVASNHPARVHIGRPITWVSGDRQELSGIACDVIDTRATGWGAFGVLRPVLRLLVRLPGRSRPVHGPEFLDDSGWTPGGER